MSAEITVMAVLTVRPGMEDRAEQLVTQLVAPTHAEEGCLLYAAQRGLDPSPVRFGFVERWRSAELLEAHLASHHVQQFGLEADACFSSVDIHRFESIPAGDPTKGTLELGG